MTQFQINNERELLVVNATLQPDPGIKTGKIGIFLFGQAGDLMTAMSVLKYRNELWPEKDIIWFCNLPNAELLKYAPIKEVRPYPWAGNGLPEGHLNFYPYLCDENNRLNKELAANFKLTEDLEEGYFPAPHMMTPPQRHGLDYPNVSKKVFGVPDDWEWHPCLEFVEEDYDKVESFLDEVGKGKIVFIETFAGSGQSLLDEEMVTTAMAMCDDVWADCKFIFGSHKFLRNKEAFPEHFFENINVYSCKDFTVRQCALIAGSSDLIISVSSGLTVAASCWYNKPVPTLQFTGSSICGTKALALGEIVQVFADDRTIQSAKQQFYNELTNLLNKYK